MATIYQGGQSLPSVGSAAYKAAQSSAGNSAGGSVPTMGSDGFIQVSKGYKVNSQFADPALVSAAKNGTSYNSKASYSPVTFGKGDITTTGVNNLSKTPMVSPYTSPYQPGAFAGSLPQIDTNIQEVSPAQQRINELRQQQDQLYGKYDQSANRFNELNQQYGVESNLKELKQVQQQIQQARDQFALTNNNIGSQAIPSGIILKQQAVNQAASEAHIGALSAYASALQGNIQLASQLIDRAISTEYKPILARIDYIQGQLRDNYDQLSKEEQRKAKIQDTNLEIQKQGILDFSKQKTDALKNALINKAPQEVISALQQSQDQTGLYKAGGQYIVDSREQLQNKLLQSNINENNAQAMKAAAEAKAATGSSGDVSQIAAYAQQYASDGKIPPGLPKNTFGAVAQAALELPQQDGAIVDSHTGVKASKLSNLDNDAIQASYNLVTKTLPALKQAFNDANTGVIAGGLSKLGLRTENLQKFEDLRTTFLNQLLLANSGKVVSDNELARYQTLLPTSGANALFTFGRNGDQKLKDITDNVTNALDSKLSNTNTAIYGYSKVKVNGVPRTVGEVIDLNGQQFRVLPNGKLTDNI